MSDIPVSNGASRLAGLPRQAAVVILVALALIIAVSIAHFYSPSTNLLTERLAAPVLAGTDLPDRDPDLTLYRKITEQVAAGKAYYPAAAEELRQGNYPLKPFVTFRLPTLALLAAALGRVPMLLLLYTLMLVTSYTWWKRLDHAFDDSGRRISGAMLIGAGMAVGFSGKYVQLHDLWSGILVALSIAVHREERPWPAVLAAALALAIRELALPFVLLMGAFALFRRKWHEFAGWTALVLIFAIGLMFHIREVNAVVHASDPASPGWASLGGWSGFLNMVIQAGPFRSFPPWIAIVASILGLFGWATWKSRTGLFCTLFFSGYGLIFMVFGRPENFYWGLMVVPTLFLGLVFLPRAFTDLRVSLGGRVKRDLLAS